MNDELVSFNCEQQGQCLGSCIHLYEFYVNTVSLVAQNIDIEVNYCQYMWNVSIFLNATRDMTVFPVHLSCDIVMVGIITIISHSPVMIPKSVFCCCYF